MRQSDGPQILRSTNHPALESGLKTQRYMTQNPKIGIDQLWEVIQESDLLAPAQFLALKKNSQSSTTDVDSDAIARWLVKEKVLTPLQSEVLLSGHAGPFDFGRYRLQEATSQKDVWLAYDRKTSHPVWLHFFSGSTREDLKTWDAIEQLVEQARTFNSPAVVRIYECVVTRAHRFVATEIVAGDSLAKKMPLKRRLGESQALGIIQQVAGAVVALEEHGIRHGALTLEHVFPNVKQGSAKVLLPLRNGPLESNETDTNSLGRILFRLLTGRDAPEAAKISKATSKFLTALQSRDVSDKTGKLILKSVTADQSLTAKEFLKRVLQVSATNGDKGNRSKALPTEAVFVAGLSPWKKPSPVVEEAVPEMASDQDAASVTPARHSRKWPVALSLGATLCGFAILLGVAALLANLKKLDPPRPEVAVNEDELADALALSSEAKRKKLAELTASQSYVQELIADDQQTLWESPTTGFPIDVSTVPPSPRMVAAVRWRSIHESESGLRSIKSLGPQVDSMLRQLESRIGFPLAEIESSIISLHSDLKFEYESAVSVKLFKPVSLDQCLAKWGQPEPMPGIENGFGKTLGDAWWVNETDENGDVISFLVGPSERVQQVAGGEVAALSGTLRKLVASSDSNRDVNLVLPVIALFNTEGQKLFSGQKKWLNEFRLMLPAAVVGVSASLHFDEGDYLELRIDHTTDLKPGETATTMSERVSSTLQQVQVSLGQRQALPYWEPVRARFGAMLRDLSGQLRWDSEFGEVVGNAWLPPGAMHNLFTACELAIAFEPQKADLASLQKPKTPQNLQELLASKRDLNIANPPDLNVLLRDIGEEISDQYLDLPFEFSIRIAGTDLQKDGITQNQRPGPLEISNQSVSEILTQVMVSANPNKDITGASDQNCKLVWVVAEDSESPGKKFVLITTRAAAEQKGYVLPEDFQIKPQ